MDGTASGAVVFHFPSAFAAWVAPASCPTVSGLSSNRKRFAVTRPASGNCSRAPVVLNRGRTRDQSSHVLNGRHPKRRRRVPLSVGLRRLGRPSVLPYGVRTFLEPQAVR